MYGLNGSAGRIARRLAVSGLAGVLAVGLAVATARPVSGATSVWSIVDSGPKAPTTISAISCVSSTSCKAVGTNGSDSATQTTFVESWGGKMWSVMPSPKLAGSVLLGVSCVSTAWCQSVGWYENTTFALTTMWNGHSWSKVSSAHPLFSNLRSVSCVSRAFCMAVGTYLNADAAAGETLIESWNGHAWSVVSSPNLATQRDDRAYDELTGVSCASRQSCMAVGEYSFTLSDGSSLGRPLIESWNGKTWKIVPSPSPVPANEFIQLTDVSCAPSGACAAVGNADGDLDGGLRNQGLIEQWNGKIWSVASTPTPALANEYNAFSGVSCVSRTACQAVGSRVVNNDVGRTLVESWNGHTWSTLPSPDTGAAANGLHAVSCVRAASCVAVGTPDEAYG